MIKFKQIVEWGFNIQKLVISKEIFANILFMLVNPRFFNSQPSRTVRVLFSPMTSGWAGGQEVGQVGSRKSLYGLYPRNHKV